MAYALAVDVRQLEVDRSPLSDDAAVPGAADQPSAGEGDQDKVISLLLGSLIGSTP